ncbi:uncharacterized protein LOC114179787 [Vigna unguiculata]|uniref:Uncharacterized protein n=1 Tax=Vigna unguiculata TaxID=3917 RepID=A0A4D6L0M5_VIGUN|nr:uncharacterized protein LOC114179787 [Vigna unguiculata]QCD81074.1 hypothetical protein DEO72_LG2g1398 [Vigna unguiculata]
MTQTEPPSSPSFGAHSSDSFPHIATRVVHELRSDIDDTLCKQNDDVDLVDDFEFSFGHTDSSPVSADDIFCNGQIRPFYAPLHRDAASHSSVTSIPVKTTSRPRVPLKTLMLEERETVGGNNDLEGVAEGTYCVWTPPCKKTTASAKRWRFRDLVRRSHTGGQKDSLLFVGPSKRTSKVVPKHASTQNNGGAAAKLVGFFTNANGPCRNNFQPFSS